MKHLLEFDEGAYNSTVQSIKNHALKLVEAANEMQALRLPRPKPKDLLDGVFVEKVIDFYKKEWSNNSAFKHVSFEKYLEFVELDTSKLEELELQYRQGNNGVLSYYKFNHYFYSYIRSRKEYGAFMQNSGEKVQLNFSNLFVFKGEEVIVNLDKEYFKLYATSESQLTKIRQIESFVKSARDIKAEYKSIKAILGSWVSELAYDLSSFKINYYHLFLNA